MLTHNNFSKPENSLFRLLGAVLLFIATQVNANSDIYVPPIGIPAPEFGINESHTMYADVQYDFGNGLEPYRDAGNGPYTHYVDNSVDCSNSSGNSFGTEANPRCTLPDLGALAVGSVVEIHGGTYTSSRNWLTSSGTVDRPIFIRGYADPKWVIRKDESTDGKPVFVQASGIQMPVIERTLRIRGSYIIVENIDFNLNDRRTGAVDIRPASGDPIGGIHHIAIRNSEVQNYGYHSLAHTNDPGSLLSASGREDDYVHDIVFYKNNIHADNSFDGFNEHNDPVDTSEDDTIGVGITSWSNRVWVLDNHIHHNAGDAVGTGHRANHTARNYYIGRNIMNDCDENAVDIKSVENFVISQNIMYNFYGASLGSNGTIAVLHSGPVAAPINSWFIYNEMYNASDTAVQIGGEVLHDVFIVGNVIYNISNEAGTGNAFVSWGSRKINITGNTVYNADRGIVFSGGDAAQAIIENNIFSQLNTEDYVRLSNSSYLDRAIIRNNLFHSDVFTPVVNGNSVNEINSDPLFVDPANNNFKLRNTPDSSPAIDSGINAEDIESDIYQLFQDRFGAEFNIRVDFNGLARPQQGAWDIGAHEYTDSVLEITTSSLTNGQVGNATSYPIIATGGTAPYSWSLSAGALPAGLSLDTDAGIIAGTPTVAGDYNFTLMVQDSVSASDIQILSMTIDAEAVPGDITPPVITLEGDNPQTIIVDSAYTELGATAVDNVDGDVNVTIDISAVDTATVGGYTVTYNATDAAGNAAIEITRTVNVTAMLEITTSSLTNGQVGNATSYPIIATGGAAPYSWSLSAGALPAGLSLDTDAGIIAGTPTVAGDYNFTLMVQDSVSASDIQILSMTIDAEAVPGDITPPVITLVGDNPQTIIVDNTYTELGVIAVDNVDGDVNVTIDISAVDTATVGDYTVTYNATDAAGNAAIETTRTVNVIAATVNNPGEDATDDSNGGGALGGWPLLVLMLIALRAGRWRWSK